MDNNAVIRAAFVLRHVASKDWIGFRRDVLAVAALYDAELAGDAKGLCGELEGLEAARVRTSALLANHAHQADGDARPRRLPSR